MLENIEDECLRGYFEENDDFSAILKNIVDLESGDIANSREAQLQSSSQDPSHERDAPRHRSGRRTSQSVLYGDFVEVEFQRRVRKRLVKLVTTMIG